VPWQQNNIQKIAKRAGARVDGLGSLGTFLTRHFVLFGIELQYWMGVAVLIVALFVLYERWKRSR
jgi:hypothetical protein